MESKDKLYKINYKIISMKYTNRKSIILTNTLNGKSLEINEDTLQIVKFFINGRTIAQCVECIGISEEDIKTVLEYLYYLQVMEDSQMESLEVDELFDNSIIERRFFDSSDNINGKKISILGIPYDGAVTGAPGCKLGVNKLRRFASGYSNEYTLIDGKENINYANIEVFKNDNVYDLGDVLYIAGESSKQLHNRVEEVYKENLENGKSKIIAIGGDHSITYPIIKSFDEEIVFVKIDAHYDSNTIVNGVINHANFVSAVGRIGNVEKIIHVGVREAYRPTFKIDDHSIVSVEDIKNKSFKNIFKEINSKYKVYISIDVDALDPLICPGTGFTIPFGLDVEDITKIIDYINETADIAGIDIVEYNPLLDKDDITAYAVLKLLRHCIESLIKN